MKLSKRIVSVVLLLTLVFSLCSIFSPVANAASGKSKSFNAFTTKTITVTTKAKGSPSITFKSTGLQGISGAEAPILSLKVFNHSTGKTQWYRVTGNRLFESVSSTLKLNKNTKYTITVSYIYTKSVNWGTWLGVWSGKETGWYQGTWRITSTKNLTYSIK